MISQGMLSAMASALQSAKDEADRAEANAPGFFTSGWASLIGASAGPAKNLAIATRNDANRFQADYDRIVNDPESTDYDAGVFVNNVNDSVRGGQSSNIIAQTTEQLSPTAAVEQTAAGTWKDLKADAKTAATIGGISLIVILAIALPLLFIFYFGKR